VAFMPQVLRFQVDFWARVALLPIMATLSPPHRHKYGPAVNTPVMKRLPESH
jgi:hypothetical protein